MPLPFTALKPKAIMPGEGVGVLHCIVAQVPGPGFREPEAEEPVEAGETVDRIIFCVFLDVDFKIYKKKMNEFFPTDDNNEEEDVDMKEDSDENGSEEKQRTEEMEGQSQEADSIKDDDTKKDEVADHSVHDQDYPNGKENDSMKNEVKIETESHSSYMETEELPSIQEDARMVEQPEVILIADDQEEKGSETGRTALKVSRIVSLDS
ncbi:ADP-ribose glycohydrolase MACROD2 [Orycteropus afer afer]|uniref:ADP-ribose glycohydrolase MACROD2 n=1 Tax=Orycteropus afer afer TaxID=1230840 RepID=A0A8B7AAV7_ORYAF|nr:ADP-ribose glycohydrolase MACROD2 [Orycteropus afer afer]